MATAGSQNLNSEVSVPVETNVKSKRGKSKAKAAEKATSEKAQSNRNDEPADVQEPGEKSTKVKKSKPTTKKSTSGGAKKGRSKKQPEPAAPVPVPSSPLSEFEDLTEELPHVVPEVAQTKAVGASAKRKHDGTPPYHDSESLR